MFKRKLAAAMLCCGVGAAQASVPAMVCAAAHGPSGQMLRAQTQQQASVLAQAEAGYFPKLSIGGGVSRAEAPLDTWLHKSYQQVQFSWVAFDSGVTRAAVQEAHQTYEKSAWSVRQQYDALAMRVLSRYLDVIRAMDQVQVVERVLAYQEVVLSVAQLKRDRGLVTGLEVSQAESGVAQTQATLHLMTQSLEAARRSFSILAPGVEVFDLKELTNVVPADVPEGAYSVHEAEAELLAAQAGKQRALRQFGPTVTLAVSAQDMRQENAAGLRETKQWEAGVTWSLPLYTGGVRRAQVDGASARVIRAQAAVELAQREHEAALTSAESAVMAQQRALEAQQVAAETAKHAATLAEGRYAAGVGSYLEVTQALAQWAEAEGALVTARIAFVQKQLERWQIRGGLYQQVKGSLC